MSFHDRLETFRDEIEGDFALPAEATRFLKYMKRNHPAELAEWMEAKAHSFVVEALRYAERSDRSKALHRAGARSFAAAINETDPEVRRGLFRTAFVIDEDNNRRHLGEMTAKDLRFAAGRYEREGNRLLMRASFLKVLAKKIDNSKGSTLAEVMDEEEAERLYSNYSDEKLPIAA